MYLRLQLFSLFFEFYFLIFNLCVCVHIKVVLEVIFCLIILNLSLYDVKYKCIFSIKICIKVKVLDQFFYFKKITIFVHVHVRYVFKLLLLLLLF